jgi:hypothetical protein
LGSVGCISAPRRAEDHPYTQHREALGQAQHCEVLAQQDRFVRHREVDEHLVVAVAAANGGGGRRRAGLGQPVVVRQDAAAGPLFPQQPGCDARIGQYPFEFRAHRAGRQPPDLLLVKDPAQTGNGGIVEHQQVQHDIGIEHQRGRCSGRWHGVSPTRRSALGGRNP